MQDPVFGTTNHTGNQNGSQVLGFLNSNMGGSSFPIGWARDEYDASAPHGPELYCHTRSNFGAETYISMKLFTQPFGQPGLLAIWMNTGYDPDKRVDNQPGMYAKTAGGPTNAADAQEVFAGDWDDGGINASTTDPGEYKTIGSTPTTPGPSPTLDESEPGLWFPNNGGTDTYDIWYLYDPSQAAGVLGGSRSLALVWYYGNAMMGAVMGKVIYDDETPGSVDKLNGDLLTTWQVAHDDKDVVGVLPSTNSLGGEVTQTGNDRNPHEVIRPFTPSGGAQWPPGTANGLPLMRCGTVVIHEGHLEAGDHLSVGDKSAHHRPDQGFDESHNSLQPDTFPNPRTTIHYDYQNTRRAYCRHRYVARLRGGEIDPATPPVDWLDSGFYFPWYFAPVRGQSPGDIENNGTRRYMVFPGNNGGDEDADDYRYAGLAFRISDAP